LASAIFSAVQAADNPAASSAPATLPIQLNPIKNEAFWPGEKCEFDIKYEFIRAGQATMEVSKSLVVNGRPTISFVSMARSSNFIDKFFKVRDYNASQVDEQSLASVNFHQNLHEGKYAVIRNTTIDYARGKYYFERSRRGNLTKREGEIRQPVSDILAGFFHTRTLPLEPGKEYSFEVFSDEQIYPLKVSVDKDVEKVKVDAGTFECLKVRPMIIGDAIFRASEGKMTIWVTNDARKIPVLIRSKVAVGAFDAELVKYEPGQAPLSAGTEQLQTLQK
jgi:hypothetical protein